MDSKLLLVQAITLLYKESLLDDASSGSGSLVTDVIDTVVVPEMSIETERDRSAVSSLRSTALWMASNRSTTKYDRTELLQRIRINIGDDPIIIRSFEDAFNHDDVDPEKVRETVKYYRNQFRSYLQRTQFKKMLQKASKEVLFNEDNVNWDEFSETLKNDIENLGSFREKELHAAIVHEVDFAEREQLQEQLNKAQAELSTEGALQTGIQALNDMMGSAKGFRRGESVAIYACPHSFKSGLLLTIFKNLCMYNDVYLRDPKKKPMMLFLSFENEIDQNIGWLYASIKENETGEEVDLRKVSSEEAGAYVSEKLKARGWHQKMLRIDPSNFTYRDLFDLFEYYEEQGYEIAALFLDYLNMMSKRGCDEGPSGFNVRDLFRRTRNFTSQRGTTLITPHQLSSEAKALKRQGVDNFLDEIVDKGYLDSCRNLDQEVDLEIYIDKEKIAGRSYLHVHRGKHRKIEITPEKYLKTVLPFHPVAGAIRDDVGREDTRLKFAGQDLNGGSGGDEKPWFQN